jgi:hypothetical protein
MCSRKSRPKQAQTGPKVGGFFLTASLGPKVKRSLYY